MATVGLDKLYYANITENAHEEETYTTPGRLNPPKEIGWAHKY